MKQTPFFSLVSACWRSTAPERPRLFLFLFLFILSCSTDLLIPWVIGYTLNNFVKQGLTDASFIVGIYGVLGYISLRMLQTLFHHTARYVQNTVTYIARMEILEHIFTLLMRFPIGWHVRHHSGENLSKLYRSSGAVESTVGTFIWQMVEGVVKVFFAAGALFMLDHRVAWSVLIMSFLTIIAMIMFNRRLLSRIRRNFGFANKINRICVDYLSNIITVKTLGLERAASKYLASQKMEGLVLSQKISKYSELKWCTTSVGHGLVTGLSLLIYFSANKGKPGPFDVGSVYVLLSYLDRIFAAVGSFTGYYGGLVEAATGYEDAHELEKNADQHPLPEIEKSAESYSDWRRLSIEHLNFSYHGSERMGLNDVNLTITSGDKIALVGPSGGGKSTLLKTIGGLLTPESGQFLIDDKVFSPAEISNISLLVPQEPEIFSETMLYNLTMGDNFPEETLNTMVEICKLSGVIAKLTDGWNTDLAEKGLNLSVGEKQRVAITRGLLRVRNRQILLLDEPTSSLDPNTEKAIFISLLEHFKEKTLLTACHRLNLVPLFNKVVYVQNGKVEEVGSFDELLAKGGLFAAAWEEYQKRINKG